MAGRRCWRYINGVAVEITPPTPLPEMMFEGTFVSPVDGSIIRNKYDLHRHNQKNNVTQYLPGMHEDILSRQRENVDKAFGKASKRERLDDVQRAIANLESR